ncbi:MAG TPA: hypothetical protein VIN71_03630 [Pseudomonadales bacterium]
MDDTEQIVRSWLQQQGYQQIVYEPDGNVTPDFVLDGRIAVEVRRLNLNTIEHRAGRADVAPSALCAGLQALLAELSVSSTSEQSWLLDVRYRSRQPDWSALRPVLARALADFACAGSPRQGIVFSNDDMVIAALARSPRSQQNEFVLLRCQPSETPLATLLLENIRYCSNEKLAKIARVRDKYPQWWLVLVNYLSVDISVLAGHGSIGHDWDRIVLLTPDDPQKTLEL